MDSSLRVSFSAGLSIEPPGHPESSPLPSSSAAAFVDISRSLHISQTDLDHIRTHHEKKQKKMPKKKADSWPNSILTDPDVLSLDDEGRFVLCKVCHVHYAVHGGKKPKPVIMNSGFRTRAWEVHKERTNSHRLEKKLVDPQHRRSELLKDKTSVHKSNKEVESLEKSHEQHGEELPHQPTSQDVHRSNSAAPSLQSSILKSPSQMNPPDVRRAEHSQATSQGGIRWTSKYRLPHQHHQTDRIAPKPPNIPERGNGTRAKSSGKQPMTMEQMDGLIRWKNIHNDVSRALGPPRLKRPLPAHDRGVGIRSTAQQLVETEDFNGNNEKVAKKLKFLDAEYDAKVLKRPEVFCDRRSATYKQYWGTLRDVYTSGSLPTSHNESASVNNNGLGTRIEPTYHKETREDTSTPDDSG